MGMMLQFPFFLFSSRMAAFRFFFAPAFSGKIRNAYY